MWKRITLMAVMLCWGLLLSARDELQQVLPGNEVWLQKKLKWESAPRKIDPKLSAAAAIVIEFRADGKFGMFGGTIYRRNSKINLSVGDSESLYQGKWSLTESGIHTTYQLVYHDIHLAGESLPGPIGEMNFRWDGRKRILTVWGSTGIRLDGEEFVVNAALSKESAVKQIMLDHQW
jgi:hypothetical protein